jgi:hypothetical protein
LRARRARKIGLLEVPRALKARSSNSRQINFASWVSVTKDRELNKTPNLIFESAAPQRFQKLNLGF